MVCAPILSSVPFMPSVPFNCYKHIAKKLGQLELFRECSPKRKLFSRSSVAGNYVPATIFKPPRWVSLGWSFAWERLESCIGW